ncbi:HAD family hydrolase [Streptomyces sp. NPDC020965]|uniref:HAD family hydrolase n=1 Tax=Streptomyces sp. NPDC020965 TaxID=3365105 RepID=UPI0037A0FA9B
MSFRHPVIAFDLDGTLLRNTSGSLLLAHAMGHLTAVEELERLYAEYGIDHHEYSTREAPLFAGTTTGQIRDHLRDAPWIGGLEETFTELADAGCTLLLATLAWEFVSEAIEHRPWFAAVSGVGMEINDGVLSGRVSRHMSEDGKVTFVDGWCRANGVALADVAAVGDSRSDVSLFRAAGTTIALNATPDARAVADHVVDTDDLRDILPLLR